jgi:hypothetical protein
VRNKWTIFEQVNHLVDAQDILIGRFRQFELENLPHIQSYEPEIKNAKDFQTDHGMKLLTEKFLSKRKELTNMLRGYDAGYWEKTGTHDVFKPYSAQILLTHTLNVDYAHLINIEQLGLTRDDFENKITTNT